ncbi:MAG: type II toxin-antitoxin system VapC family toxin [Pyrinomonadaceae bacterium]|nr:type II toxin-antitoxin system VapC family toxin [Pyrinomonadaceae bacterium]
MNLLIDTDVLSFTYKKDSRSTLYESYLKENFLIISFMTLAELNLWTLRNNWGEKRKNNLAEFLKDYLVIYADEKLCEIWAEIKSDAHRKGRPIETADAWVAAVALMFNIPLVTNNRKHFENVGNLQIISEA